LSEQLLIPFIFYENTAFFTHKDFLPLHAKQCHMQARLIQSYGHEIPSISEIKKTIRDCYSPLISPEKVADDPNFLKNSKVIYSEPSVILNKYKSADDKFLDLYTQSTLKQKQSIIIFLLDQQPNYIKF